LAHLPWLVDVCFASVRQRRLLALSGLGQRSNQGEYVSANAGRCDLGEQVGDL
jgi:hypothetical protein